MKMHKKIGLLFVLGTTCLGVNRAFAGITVTITSVAPNGLTYTDPSHIQCSQHGTVVTGAETYQLAFTVSSKGADGFSDDSIYSQVYYNTNSNETFDEFYSWDTNGAVGSHTVTGKVEAYRMNPAMANLGTLATKSANYTVQ